MPLTRREAIAALSGGIAGHATGSAWAQENHAGKTIKLIVPYPAGGTTDLLGRMIAEQLETGLSATVIVENKPGAGTTLGAEQVAKAEPDGTTLLMATSTTLAVNKTLYRTLPYDPVKDFAPIALVAAVPFTLVVNPKIPVRTLAEFIAYARSKPGLSAMAARSIWARKCCGLRPGSTSATFPIAAACRRCSM
jgi:tripartite-type tricarboxylate transporter receptor subunit TctC